VSFVLSSTIEQHFSTGLIFSIFQLKQINLEKIPNFIKENFVMQNKTQKYFKTTNNSFLDKSIILYFEDERDDTLNVYIQKKIEGINRKLSFSGKRLFYYPSCVLDSKNDNKALIDFIRYRSPLYYSIGDAALGEAISGLFNSLSPKDFYGILKNELNLHELSGPALLKLSSDEFDGTDTLVCDTIEYKNEQDIDRFFDEYIKGLDGIRQIHCSKSRGSILKCS